MADILPVSAMNYMFAAYEPSIWMVSPFVMLLAIIALAPLFCADWWGKHYPKVAFTLGATVVVYYLFRLGGEARITVAHTAMEYISFICLIGSLFVISGGIHISIKGESTPMANTVFLAIGAIIANLLGTTGASMLMIRPWLRMNKYRLTQHHVIFFIFIVSNVGGCLTPIGDPPLFLGYLKGIPFWWVIEHCWPMWLTGVGILLAMFFVVDNINYKKAPKPVREIHAEPNDTWKFEGLSNVFFLAVILGAVFINHPTFLREALMVGAALGSWLTTRKNIHESNQFTWHPIKEVAILFIGIFATMMPALDLLRIHAAQMGNPPPAFFYWGSGTLSSVLDNAPTYLNFLSASMGSFAKPELIQQIQNILAAGGIPDLNTIVGPNAENIKFTLQGLQKYFATDLAAGKITADQISIAVLLGNPSLNAYIIAVSIGSVFFGANTYIGNGPNFMVKSIADHANAHTPTFIGYIFKFTLPIMLPMLIVVWLLFFR